MLSHDRRDDIISLVRKLRAHKRFGRSSPHKALLLLHALGRLASGQEERLQAYSDLEAPLATLIGRFGWPDTTARNPHSPFTALRNDGLWEVPGDESLSIGRDELFSPLQLRERAIKGGLPEDMGGAILRRRIPPSQPVAIHEYGPNPNPPVINPWNAPRLDDKWPKAPKLRLGQPEQITRVAARRPVVVSSK